VPAELERIIGQLLQKDRALRYPSAAELRDDLQRLQTGFESGRYSRQGPKAAVEVRHDRRRNFGGGRGRILLLATEVARRYSRTRITIVLADFTNNTGDPVFDETLRQGLAIQLEQSPFISLVSDDAIPEDASV